MNVENSKSDLNISQLKLNYYDDPFPRMAFFIYSSSLLENWPYKSGIGEVLVAFVECSGNHLINLFS